MSATLRMRSKSSGQLHLILCFCCTYHWKPLADTTWRPRKRAKVETPPNHRTVSVPRWESLVSPLEESVWIKLIFSKSQRLRIPPDQDRPGRPARQIVRWRCAPGRLIKILGPYALGNCLPIFSLLPPWFSLVLVAARTWQWPATRQPDTVCLGSTNNYAWVRD